MKARLPLQGQGAALPNLGGNLCSQQEKDSMILGVHLPRLNQGGALPERLVQPTGEVINDSWSSFSKAQSGRAKLLTSACFVCAGTTSQPSMGAIVNALHGTSLATGIDPLWLARLSIYWEQVCAFHSLMQ